MNPDFERTIMSGPQRLKNHEISKRTQITNEPQISKESQFSKETQIMNEDNILKRAKFPKTPILQINLKF